MELQAAYEAIRAEGAEVLAVSVDNTADARRMADYAQAGFPVLADEGAAVTKNYGIYNLLSDGVAAPATFILRSDATVYAHRIGQDIGDRVSSQSIIETLRALRGDDAAPS